MSASTPDILLKLAADLTAVSAQLSDASGKLAVAANTLAEEAANIAAENTKNWGVDVQVAVRTGPYRNGAAIDGGAVVVKQ
ncbi:hypothetical protein ACN47E_001298 [Coniothyrium glycines]